METPTAICAGAAEGNAKAVRTPKRSNTAVLLRRIIIRFPLNYRNCTACLLDCLAVTSCAGCQLRGETPALAGSCSQPRNLLGIKRICHSGIMGARTWSGGEELTLSRRTGCPLNDGHHAVRCPQKSAWKPLQNHSGHIRDSLRCVEHLWGCIASLTVRESEFGLPDKHCWSGNR